MLMCLGTCEVVEEGWLVSRVVEGSVHPQSWSQERFTIQLRPYFPTLCAVTEVQVDRGCWRFLCIEWAHVKFSLSLCSFHLRLEAETSPENILLLHDDAKDIELLAALLILVYCVYPEFDSFSLSGWINKTERGSIYTGKAGGGSLWKLLRAWSVKCLKVWCFITL